MKFSHYQTWLATAVVLLLVAAGSLRAAQAQDLDPYHAFILEHLAEEYNITGGEFVIGTSENDKLDNPNSYGTSLVERRVGDPGDVHPFDYVHAEAGIGTNPWDAGISWTGTAPVIPGQTGLAVFLARGETDAGAAATVNIVFERNSDPYDKSLDEGGFQFNADWQLVLLPFEFTLDLPAGQSQLGLHLAYDDQYVDMTAPIVLNFDTKYSPEVLQGMIDSGGQVPLLASFTKDVIRGVPPFTVNFDASGSTSSGEITNYAWNFGDGTTGNGVTVSHTYDAIGAYEVVLTVTDNTNASTSSSQLVRGFDGVGLPESPLQIPFTAEAPTIDGTIDGVWNSAVTVDIDWVVNDNPPVDESDVSGTASALWDAQYLYVLYEVTDDVKNNDSEASYQDDAVDLYVDGLNEKSATYDSNDAQYEMSWGDDTFTFTGNAVDNGRVDGAEYRWSDTASGYVIEARIPWSNLETLPLPGTQIGIDFMINDADLLGDVRDTKLSWYAMTDLAYQNPSLFATAELVGGEGQILTAHFSITADAFVTDMPVTFNASQSVAPGEIVSFEWDFGDGSTAEGEIVEHAFQSVGRFTITLTITDDTGASVSTSRSINVVDGLGTPEKPLPVPQTATAPTIDGQMEGLWQTSAVSVQLLNELTGNPLTSENDLLPTAYTMWDATHIYVYFDIVDDALITNDSPDNETYKDDTAEFFLDADNSKTESAHDENDGQFSIRLHDPVMTGDAADKYPNTQFATAETDQGWALEMAVPWADVDATPSIGMLIGIEFQVNDDDDGGERDHKAAWFGTTDNAWQWAHVFGTAVLTEPLVVNTEKDATLPERFAIESVYPNPFNPTTTAVVSLREIGAYDIRVYNVLGQLVEERSLEVQQTGRIELGFDLSSRASGMYLISIEHKATGKSVSARAMLLK